MLCKDCSFYALEAWTETGDGRQTLIFISSRLEEVEQALAYSLDFSDAVFQLIWYGRQINLHVYQDGQHAQCINLLPYLTIHMPDFPQIDFDQQGAMRGICFSDLSTKGDRYADFEIESEEFLDLISDDNFAFEVEIDWEPVPVPILTGRLAMPGNSVAVETHFEGCCIMPYGLTELASAPLIGGADLDWEIYF